jgi:superfamily II DNA/RNA helicase
VIVFFNTKRKVDVMEAKLSEEKMDVMCLHGDKDQRERDNAMNCKLPISTSV